MHLASSRRELELISVKLTNNRTYLDYNATAPLADSVIDWLAKGAFPFGNPSSIHTSGKKSKRLINETSSYLKSFFSLNDYEVFYHSGATEGINNIIKGFCFHHVKHQTPFHVAVFKTDHSCVVNQREHVELLGGHFHQFDVCENGEFNLEEVISTLNKLEGKVLLNYTLVNNETGVYWPLDLVKEIKERTDAIIHVDAVQLIGKVSGDLDLDDSIDFYTFSGHKFGAIKGIGFTLVKDMFANWCSLIRGGGQQQAMRSGTENVHGIYSIKLALEEISQNFKPDVLKREKDFLEREIESLGSNKIIIAGKKSKRRNLNTIYMIIKDTKTDILITAFDMAQIDLSSGSACSSGAVKPSRVLLAMGYSEEEAKSSIRISLPSVVDEGDGEILFSKIQPILSRFL